MNSGVATSKIPCKRIALIGAGAAGLVAIKTLRSTPEFERGEWEIFCFEQRNAVGGIWLPDPLLPTPPALPQSPLYPSLTTNLPHPIMSYRDFSFPPATPLYPPADTVLQYLQSYEKAFKLKDNIRFNTKVDSTEFGVGGMNKDWQKEEKGAPGKWTVITRNLTANTAERHSEIDTLILANGRHSLPHFPHSPVLQPAPSQPPQIPGLDRWLESRRAIHAMYYRTPLPHYHGRTVLVVGDGPSARDIVEEIAGVTQMLWRSVRSCIPFEPESGGLQDPTSSGTGNPVSPQPAPPKTGEPSIRLCAPISSLGSPPPINMEEDSNSQALPAPNVFLADGQSLKVDYIIFGTGYELSFAFLPESILDRQNDNADLESDVSGTINAQDTNKPLSLYRLSLSPLIHHLLPSSPTLPLGSLFILGLPRSVVPFPLIEAQCRLLTATLQGRGQLHPIFRADHVGSVQGRVYGGNGDPRNAAQEAEALSRRYHLFESPNDQFDYRHSLILMSMEIPPDEEEAMAEIERMVPEWHRTVYENKVVLRNIWRDLERRGVAEDVVRDVGKSKDAEREWVELMEKLLRETV